MKSRLLCFLAFCVPMVLCAQSNYVDLNKNGRMDAYENRNLSIEQRVDDLVAQMTLAEKVGQLQMTMGWDYYQRNGDEVFLSEKFKSDLRDRNMGCVWALMRADPWTQRNFDNGLLPVMASQLVREMQLFVRQHSRLGIPLLLAEECPHGLMALEAPVFPTAIGRASSFNADLEYKIGYLVGQRAYNQGANVAFGPVVDIARDPRWSRFEENYGEDPTLSAVMGTQYALGLQKAGVISTLKHFTAYGCSEGGHNGASVNAGIHELLSALSYPFMKALQKGALSVMTAYNAVDGVPCTANEWLLNDVLRKTWNFDGLVISDLFAIDGLVSERLATDKVEAAVLAIRAGVNVDLGASCYGQPLIDAVHQGLVSEKMLDEVLRPVLTMKFKLGLFDTDFQSLTTVENNDDLLLESAYESVVLLKNEGNLLPLSKELRRVAVIGPNADNVYNMLGDYTAPQHPESVVTLLEGLREALPQTEIDYVQACSIRDTSWQEIDRAVLAAKRADVVIMALGGSSARDFQTVFESNGAAASRETVSDMEAGEGFDRATLSLLGHQQALLEAVCATGKPVVLVLIQGRPLNITWATQYVPAILCAWYPGGMGGRAIADLLLGNRTPSGHLPISYPRDENQLPVYYNALQSRRNYTDASAQPLFPFGFGLSYTSFKYSDSLSCEKISENACQLSFTITNTGDYDGAEVVQLYVRDEAASVIQPERQLKQFKKIFLKKGESGVVDFILTDDDLKMLNRDLQWVVEPGEFRIFIGPNVENPVYDYVYVKK